MSLYTLEDQMVVTVEWSACLCVKVILLCKVMFRKLYLCHPGLCCLLPKVQIPVWQSESCCHHPLYPFASVIPSIALQGQESPCCFWRLPINSLHFNLSPTVWKQINDINLGSVKGASPLHNFPSPLFFSHVWLSPVLTNSQCLVKQTLSFAGSSWFCPPWRSFSHTSS